MDLKCGWWHACYRRTPLGRILDDTNSIFYVIPNNWYASVMDPFVFEHDGETFIFAELYDIFRQRGTIGYTKWNEKKQRFGKWKIVLVEPFHLSYPYIFAHDGEIYMVPESYESESVILYRATSFPNQWEKVRVLKEHVKYVDTSIFFDHGKAFAFTYDISDQSKKTLLLYRLDKDFRFVGKPTELSQDDGCARPGGSVFTHDGQMVRVGQDCDGEYGKAIVFRQFTMKQGHTDRDHTLLHFGIENLRVDKNVSRSGIHNYSGTDSFEVIDVKGKCFHPIELFARCIYKFRRKLHRG